MSGKIFANANILVGENLDIVRGYVKVRDGVVREIAEGEPPEVDFDMEGDYVLPPFVNGHTHVGDSVKTDLYHGRTQSEVVGEGGVKFDALEGCSEREKMDAMRESLDAMRDFGVLAHCDFRESGIEGCKMLESSSNESVTSVVMARPKNSRDFDGLLSHCDGLGIPSLDFLSTEGVDRLLGDIKDSGKLLSFHVSETKEAHEKSLEETGRTEIARALEHDPSYLVHGTWATREDLRSIKDSGIPLVLCTRANSLLSVGLPRINQVLEEDVDFWLGTDNVSVCPPDMLAELSYAWAILRLQSADAGAAEARELLKAATVNPMDFLDLPFGPIEEGNGAAFLVLSGERFERSVDPYVGIVNRARSSDIKDIYLPDR